MALICSTSHIAGATWVTLVMRTMKACVLHVPPALTSSQSDRPHALYVEGAHTQRRLQLFLTPHALTVLHTLILAMAVMISTNAGAIVVILVHMAAHAWHARQEHTETQLK